LVWPFVLLKINLKMYYKIFSFICIFFLLDNCSTNNLINNRSNQELENLFTNKGFTLIYDKTLYDKKVVSQKIQERSLIIFQKNLKINTQVKIKNISNDKTLIAIVGKNSIYPSFNNSVISPRIAKELKIDINEPYIEITALTKDSLFVAKRAKTFEEEKNVANKVPVSDISINDLNVIKAEKKTTPKIKFLFVVKIGDFYFKETALTMIKRIKDETIITKPQIKKISDNKYRVYLGPFDNINSLQKSFNDINILGFENIEIIRYE